MNEKEIKQIEKQLLFKVAAFVFIKVTIYVVIAQLAKKARQI